MEGFVAAMAAVVAGWLVLSTLHQRHERAEWQEAGKQAGLRTADNGSPPELTGTVNGRSVTARYERRTIGTTNEQGGTVVTFTLGDAALAGPADDGLVVGRAGGHVDAGVGTIVFDGMAETVSAAEGLVSAESGDLVFGGPRSRSRKQSPKGCREEPYTRSRTCRSFPSVTGPAWSAVGPRHETRR